MVGMMVRFIGNMGKQPVAGKLCRWLLYLHSMIARLRHIVAAIFISPTPYPITIDRCNNSKYIGRRFKKILSPTSLCIYPKCPLKTARSPRLKGPARAGFVLLFLGCFRGCVKNWKAQKMQLFRVENGKRSVNC